MSELKEKLSLDTSSSSSSSSFFIQTTQQHDGHTLSPFRRPMVVLHSALESSGDSSSDSESASVDSTERRSRPKRKCKTSAEKKKLWCSSCRYVAKDFRKLCKHTTEKHCLKKSNHKRTNYNVNTSGSSPEETWQDNESGSPSKQTAHSSNSFNESTDIAGSLEGSTSQVDASLRVTPKGRSATKPKNQNKASVKTVRVTYVTGDSPSVICRNLTQVPLSELSPCSEPAYPGWMRWRKKIDDLQKMIEASELTRSSLEVKIELLQTELKQKSETISKLEEKLSVMQTSHDQVCEAASVIVKALDRSKTKTIGTD